MPTNNKDTDFTKAWLSSTHGIEIMNPMYCSFINIIGETDYVPRPKYQCDYCKRLYLDKPLNDKKQECNCYGCGGLIVEVKA